MLLKWVAHEINHIKALPRTSITSKGGVNNVLSSFSLVGVLKYLCQLKQVISQQSQIPLSSYFSIVMDTFNLLQSQLFNFPSFLYCQIYVKADPWFKLSSLFCKNSISSLCMISKVNHQCNQIYSTCMSMTQSLGFPTP